MTCSCKVGPGKFEGESVETFLAWELTLNGCADEDIGRYAFVRFPLELDDDLRALAREYGYCDDCIDDAAKVAPPTWGLVVWESDQGFVNATWLDTEAEWNKAIADANDESADDEGDD